MQFRIMVLYIQLQAISANLEMKAVHILTGKFGDCPKAILRTRLPRKRPFSSACLPAALIVLSSSAWYNDSRYASVAFYHGCLCGAHQCDHACSNSYDSALCCQGTHGVLGAQGAGVQLAELDWMVCNGGADIWHLLPARGDKEATWAADEQWDAHISFRREGVP